ncbi:MAG: HepT-like ribonuclease domain-containing protein [Armatimonadota bacterium]|nr:HepT-like ribonuclease domain-containing protein [Armatimonadota bacterium]
MSERDPLVRLLHMRDYGRAVLRLTDQGSRERLDSDEMFAFAMIHALSMIGESAAGVSQQVRDASPKIPWADIVGMRHRLIHGYEYVSYDIVWETATVDVPELMQKLDTLVARLQNDQDARGV